MNACLGIILQVGGIAIKQLLPLLAMLLVKEARM